MPTETVGWCRMTTATQLTASMLFVRLHFTFVRYIMVIGVWYVSHIPEEKRKKKEYRRNDSTCFVINNGIKDKQIPISWYTHIHTYVWKVDGTKTTTITTNSRHIVHIGWLYVKCHRWITMHKCYELVYGYSTKKRTKYYFTHIWDQTW